MAEFTMLLATLVLASNIAIALYLLLNLTGLFIHNVRSLSNSLNAIIAKYALQFAFLIALVSTAGSLYFPEIAHITPCTLCWYQRILMYPHALLFGIALLMRNYNIFKYTLPLSIIGVLISAYNYWIQMAPALSTATCSATADCSVPSFLSYGYISIATMALTGFSLIIIITLVSRKHSSKSA